MDQNNHSTFIQSISAVLDHPQAQGGNKLLYCFDSSEHSLIAEPFVHSATMAIHLPLRWTLGFAHFQRGTEYLMSKEVLLRFTDSPDEAKHLLEGDHPVVELQIDPACGQRRNDQSGGHDYSWEVIHPEITLEGQFFEGPLFSNKAWLCPVLFKYFPTGAPERFWVSIQELQPPASNTDQKGTSS
jgi:hypothetical protein